MHLPFPYTIGPCAIQDLFVLFSYLVTAPKLALVCTRLHLLAIYALAGFNSLLSTTDPRATATMKFTIAVATVFTVCSVAARVVKIPLPALHDTHSSFQTVAKRNLNNSRPKVAFWDDDTASAEDWKKYTTKGGALVCGLEGYDQTAGRQMGDTRNPPSAASKFNGDLQTELHDWYWRPFSPATFSCSFGRHWQFSYAMQSLHLSDTPKAQGGDNECFRTEHWDPDSRDRNGNQIPAINQWYTLPGNSRQYHVSLPPILNQPACVLIMKYV